MCGSLPQSSSPPSSWDPILRVQISPLSLRGPQVGSIPQFGGAEPSSLYLLRGGLSLQCAVARCQLIDIKVVLSHLPCPPGIISPL